MDNPVVYHTLETLSKIRVPETFLIIGNDGREFARVPERFNGLTVHSITEDYPRGTAGCLKQIEEHLRGDTLVFLTTGLVFLTKEVLEGMVEFHRQIEADLTVGVIPAGISESNAERVFLGPNGEVTTIVHPYFPTERRSHLRTSGMYVIEPRVLRHIRADGYMDIKQQLLPKLSGLGMRVASWRHNCKGPGVPTIRDYLRLSFQFFRNQELTKEHLQGRYREIKDQVWVSRHAHISPSATLVKPLVIGDGVRIEDNVMLVGPSIIGERCVVEQGSIVRESVFWPDSFVPSNFKIDRCLVNGKVFSSDNGHCRERVVLDGEPHVDGINAALNGTTIRTVLRSRSRMDGKWYPALKRLFDVVFSALFLFFSAPVLVLAAVLIKLDSSGPVFFVQTRCGKKGKHFRMLKFRTMVRNAEELKHTLVHLNQSDGPMFKIFGDPRETRIGQLLRATNVDEIPQFINVLRGEMSVVGPRPLSLKEMRYNPHWRDVRLKVKPGITGLWQLYGKRTHSFHDWIRYDLQYVDECCLWLDMKVILITFAKAIRALKLWVVSV
jgi:lipopolysaccharide/colanic/teichoic acid biosynthesis glycosyltransferase